MSDVSKDSFQMARFGGWNNDDDEDYYRVEAHIDTWEEIRAALIVVCRGADIPSDPGEPSLAEAKDVLTQLEIRLWKAPNTKRPER